MVHRVLWDAVRVEKSELTEEEALTLYDKEAQSGQCECCNDKKRLARIAQMDCDRAFFCMYLRARGEWLYEIGTIVKMTETSLIVYVDLIGKDGKVDFCTTTEHDIPELYDFAQDGDNVASANTKQRVKDHVHFPEEWTSLASDLVRVTFKKHGSFVLGSDGKMKEEIESLKLELFGKVDVCIVPTNTVPISYVTFLASPFRSKAEKSGAMQPSLAPKPAHVEPESTRSLVVDQAAAARIVKHHTTQLPQASAGPADSSDPDDFLAQIAEQTQDWHGVRDIGAPAPPPPPPPGLDMPDSRQAGAGSGIVRS
jgi:hypothetical protein